MGMLFNTPDTLTLLRLVNVTFHRAGFTNIKNNPPTNTFLQDLQALGGGNSIYNLICTP